MSDDLQYPVQEPVPAARHPLPMVIPQPAPAAHLVHKPSPFRDEYTRHDVPEGLTLAEMVARAGLVLPPAGFDLVAAVDGELVERPGWSTTRPAAGSNVVVMTRLEGGGDGGGAGKSALMIVASLAIVAGAVATGGALGPALGGALGIGASAGVSIATGVFMSAGFLALNSLVKPPSRGTMVQPGPSHSITGIQNRANPYGPIPFVAGKMLLYPVIGGEPWTSVRGGEQWMSVLLVVGYGPLKITNIKVGDTAIEEIHPNNIRYEVLEGFPDDPDPKLYPEQVIEDQPNATVGKRAENHYIGTIGSDVDEIEVDLWFPEGLWRLADHEQQENHIIYVIEYREVGTSNWQLLHRQDLKTKKVKPFRKTHDKEVPRADYDVRVSKEKATNDVRYHETMIVTSVKGIKHARPVKMGNLAMIAMRIKADEQLNGVINRVSCEAHSVLPDYDAATNTWPERATRNPASIFRAVLQHRATSRKVGDKKIALNNPEHGLEDWHGYCQAEGWTYDAVWDQDATAYDRLTSVAFAGRASYARWNGRHAIVREKPQNIPVQHISNANSWNNRGFISYAPTPKALRVEFINRDNGFAREERFVFADGYDKANPPPRDRWDTLDLTESGITKKDDAWRHGRFFLAQAEFRTEVWQCTMDLEHLVATRGDLVRYHNDAALIGITAGTVVSATATTVTLEQHVELPAGVGHDIRFRLANGATVLVGIEAGSGRTFGLQGSLPAGEIPDPGDLYFIGRQSNDSQRCVITEIKHSSSGLHADLKLMPYDARIHSADTGPIPEYDPIVTEPDPHPRRKLGKPKIIGIKKLPSQNATRPDSLGRVRLRVSIQPPAERKVPPDTYRYRLREKGGDDWELKDDKPAKADHEFRTAAVEYGAKYEIQVRAQARNQQSAWSDIEVVDCRLAEDLVGDSPGGGGGEKGKEEEAPDRTRLKYQAKIRGLQLVDLPNKNKFTGGSARFVWRRTSSSAPQQVGKAAAGRGGQNDNFKHYKVQIRDPALGGKIRREETTTAESYDYTRSENTQDSERLDGPEAPPIRRFTIRVTPMNKHGHRGKFQELTVENPAPPAPTNLEVGGAFGQLTFSMDAPTDADYDETRVWASSTSPVALTRENLVSKGRVLSGSVAVTPGVRYFVRAAHSDLFSKDVDTLNVSPEVSADSLTIDAEGTARFGFSPPPLFTGSESPNRITWTSFTAHVLFLGNRVNKTVSAGSMNWPGSVTYMYYVNGETVVRGSTDILDAVGIDRAILAVWKGQQKIKQEGGDALIDGRDIYAGTVTSQQLITGQAVITGTAQIANAIITDAHITNLNAGKITAGSIFGQELFIGEDRVIINGPQRRITVLDGAGRVRTRLGKIPDGAGGTTFGLAIYDNNEKLIFGPFNDPDDPGDRFDGIFVRNLSVDTPKVKNRAISHSVAHKEENFEVYNRVGPSAAQIRTDIILTMPVALDVDVDTGGGAFIHGLTKLKWRGSNTENGTFDHLLIRGSAFTGNELVGIRMHFGSFIYKLPSTNPDDYVAYVPFSFHDNPASTGPKIYHVKIRSDLPALGSSSVQVRLFVEYCQIMGVSIKK